MLKQNTRFIVGELAVNGCFHFPEGDKNNLPVVVMFNGYATEWTFGTSAFIEAFTAAGFATLNFDYRSFGESEGQPRQVVDIPAQLEDCRAAIRHALDQPWVDKTRLAIWGSSLGGGHAISMAAEFPQARALVAQVPHCCSRAAMKRVKLSAIFKGMGLSIIDSLFALCRFSPILIPVVAEPEDYGVMNHPGWKKHYLQIAGHSRTWRNVIPARSLAKGGDYRPSLVAGRIACPALIVAAENDSGVPVTSVKETAAGIANSEYYGFPGEHFDVYHGAFFDDVLATELAFLKDKLWA